jgi:hypothetical protein
MHENWDLRTMPHRWRQPGFVPQSGEWSAPGPRAGGPFPRLSSKQARAIALVGHVPAVYPIA